MKTKMVEKNRESILDLFLLLLTLSVVVVVVFFVLNHYFPSTFYSPTDDLNGELPGYLPFVVLLWVVGISYYFVKKHFTPVEKK